MKGNFQKLFALHGARPPPVLRVTEGTCPSYGQPKTVPSCLQVGIELRLGQGPVKYGCSFQKVNCCHPVLTTDGGTPVPYSFQESDQWSDLFIFAPTLPTMLPRGFGRTNSSDRIRKSWDSLQTRHKSRKWGGQGARVRTLGWPWADLLLAQGSGLALPPRLARGPRLCLTSPSSSSMTAAFIPKYPAIKWFRKKCMGLPFQQFFCLRFTQSTQLWKPHWFDYQNSHTRLQATLGFRL